MSYGQRSFKSYVEQCSRWVEATYGDHSMDRKNRAARVLEEALELAQAEGVTSDEATRIAERTYSRPVGDPKQEAAGVLFTLMVWSVSARTHLLRILSQEIKRVHSKDPEYYRAKQRDKFAAGTDFAKPMP